MPKVDSWSMSQMSLMSENAFSPIMTPSLFQTGLDPPPSQRNYDGEIRQQRYLVITFDWEVLLTEDQCIWTAFCKIYSGKPHLTIFGALKYAPKYGQIHQIEYLGCVKYGRLGYPWKDLAKCSSVALIFRSIGPPSQKLWPNLIFAQFPHRNYNAMGGWGLQFEGKDTYLGKNANSDISFYWPRIHFGHLEFPKKVFSWNGPQCTCTPTQQNWTNLSHLIAQ